MKQPEFDNDGYPTEETLETIAEWRGSYRDLLEFARQAWHWLDYVSIAKTKNTFGNEVLEYTFVTGGWSGNEDVISALHKNIVFYAFCWKESHRGGRHIYEVKDE